MKHSINWFALVLFLLTILLPAAAGAAQFSAGLTSWYAKWEVDPEMGFTPDNPLLYGPVLAFQFADDFNLAFVFLYGKFDGTKEDTMVPYPYPMELARYDGDLTLNYRLPFGLRLFAGIKYLAFHWDASTYLVAYSYDLHKSADNSAYGPGAGIGVTIPFGAGFSLLANLSGMYLRGKEQLEQNGMKTPELEFREYGMNASVALAYYFSRASTTISVGGRYQHIFSRFDEESYGMGKKREDYFLGVTLSAVYTYDFSR